MRDDDTSFRRVETDGSRICAVEDRPFEVAELIGLIYSARDAVAMAMVEVDERIRASGGDPAEPRSLARRRAE